MNDLERFTEFLASVNLEGYRTVYLPVKIVEMNLPKGIQAIELLYRVYWSKRSFLDFDAFYQMYDGEKRKALRAFQKKSGMCPKCFKKGIKARTYRTWAGLITQIHAGYVAESVFGSGSVQMSEELDHSGADIQVQYKGTTLNYDVKKESASGVTGRSHAPKKPIPGIKVPIRYEVPNFESILHPRKKRGVGFKKDYVNFKKKYMDTKILSVFSNGFVVFEPTIFKSVKDKIDAGLAM